MAGMCRPSPIILLLLLVASTYGGPWSKLVPAVIASSSSAVTMEMIPQLRIELSIENCTVNGKFPIPESCETFYQCDDWDGLGMEMYQFTCPVGTIFDDHVSTCNFPSLVKSRPDCTIGEVQGNTLEEAVNFSIVHAGYEMESVDLATGNDYAVRELMLNTIRDRTKRSAIIEEDHFTEESNVTEEIDFTEDIFVEKDNITAECKGNINEHNITEYNITEEGNITDSDSVAGNALQSCKQIYYVDQYVDMVTSMIPVIYPEYLRAIFHSNAIDEYNSILEAAQNHTYIWRRGDNIMSGFRRTYELAKLFGPSFQRKYGIAHRRLEMLEHSVNDIKQENEARQDIENIQNDIKNFLDIIKENPLLFETFKPLIADKENQLTDKRQKLTKIMSAVKDLDQIVAFLESVKNDAGTIKERADVTKEKLMIFRDNTLQDKKSFIRSKTHAQSAIEESVQRVNKTIQDIEGYKEKKKKEEERSEEYKKSIAKAEAIIDKEVRDMKNFIQTYNKDMEEESGKGWFSRAWRSIFGGKHVTHLPDAMKRNQEQLDSTVTIYTNRTIRTESKLDQAAREIFDLEDRILKGGSDVRNLGFVEYYLVTVIEESDKILPYIERAIFGLSRLTNTFENIAFKLESLINKAREVQEPAEKRDFKNLFFVDMSTMQTDWNNSYSDIIDIGSCTDPVYYNALVEIIKATEPPINSISITERNCTTVIEPLTINDTITTTTTTTTTEQSLLYIDFDLDGENFI